ncbi:MAG TPA: hypothetical protein VFA82_08850 [Gaiellaceae bacterium]|nr:hypothetical protein [Gaiellaceae bacterium]
MTQTPQLRPLGIGEILDVALKIVWPIFPGYFWMLWDGEKQTFHDKFAGSVVVPTDGYPVSRRPG